MRNIDSNRLAVSIGGRTASEETVLSPVEGVLCPVETALMITETGVSASSSKVPKKVPSKLLILLYKIKKNTNKDK